ncbi:hypothetical protein OG432_24360 [Streptomyces sp. NBC_00442]|uniref:hypothetical protein n=1 Tax=Streptomyces sp. NBC_00442 TaxID=2903651 RepID=UPI002E21A985
MATTDNYGQSISIPSLTDAPNIEAAVSSTINALTQRTILRFASASARNAAIGSPVEGMQCWLQDTNTMTYYDGTQWLTYEAPQVQTYNGSVTLTTSPSAYTALNLGAQISANQPGMWSAGQPTRLVATTPGTYAVMGAIVWPGLLGSADGRAEVRLNGSGVGSNTARFSIARGSNGNAAASASGTVIFTAAGQYLEVCANQNSGGSLNVAIGVGMNRISNAIA